MSLSEAKVSVEVIARLDADFVALATKLPEDQSPLSSWRDPSPTIEVVLAYPVNANVCPVAKAEIVILELISVAFDGSVIVAVTAVLFDETPKEVLPTKPANEDDNFDNALLTSPIAEIDVVLVSILVWIAFS